MYLCLKFLSLATTTFLFSVSIPSPSSGTTLKEFVSDSRAQTIRESNERAEQLCREGMKQLNRGQLPEAARTFEQALEIHRNLGNPTLQDTSASTKEIEILRNLVEIYTLLKDSNKTIEFSHAILAKVREVGDRDTKLKYQIALGDVYNSLGEYQKAVKSASASLALAGELQNFQAQAVASITLATAYQSLESTKSDYRNATKAAISGLTTAWRVKDHDSEAKALATLGSIYNVLSKNQNAIVFAEQG